MQGLLGRAHSILKSPRIYIDCLWVLHPAISAAIRDRKRDKRANRRKYSTSLPMVGWWLMFETAHRGLFENATQHQFYQYVPSKTKSEPIPLVYPLVRYLHRKPTCEQLIWTMRFVSGASNWDPPHLCFSSLGEPMRPEYREKGLITTRPPAQNSAAWLGKVLWGGVPILPLPYTPLRAALLPWGQPSGVTESISLSEILLSETSTGVPVVPIG